MLDFLPPIPRLRNTRLLPIICVNRGVGESFASSDCWGEDSNHIQDRREAPKAAAPVRFLSV